MEDAWCPIGLAPRLSPASSIDTVLLLLLLFQPHSCMTAECGYGQYIPVFLFSVL